MWQKLFLTVEIIDSVTMVFQPHTAPTTIAPSANEYLKKKCGAGGGNNTACYILTRHVIYVLLYHPFYFFCLPWIIHFVCNADVSTHTGAHTLMAMWHAVHPFVWTSWKSLPPDHSRSLHAHTMPLHSNFAVYSIANNTEKWTNKTLINRVLQALITMQLQEEKLYGQKCNFFTHSRTHPLENAEVV